MSLQLALFVRPPRSGATKTRLIPALGPAGACALYEAFLDDFASTARRLRAQHPDVQPVLYSAEVDPGDALRERAQRWGMPLVTQVGQDLGARMTHALSAGIEACGAALVVGSDAPTLPLRILLAARAALTAPNARPAAQPSPGASAEGPSGPSGPSVARFCLGPVADGGYIAVGATGVPPSFAGVRMGTRHALADTLAANVGRPVTRLAPWYDVDTPDDLRLLRVHLALDPAAAPASAATLSRLASNLGVEPQTC